MPTILITTMSPAELFKHSRLRALAASAEIDRLRDAPLEPGETLADRTLRVAALAHELSEAFGIMETLVQAHERAESASTTSPPRSCADPAPGHRGVHQEADDPSTN